MQLVITYKERVTTTSLLVAQKFGKEHKNVLRDIQNLECSEEFRELNFELTTYQDTQNKARPMYIITRDGFTLLMMSFTGKAAAKFREEFIEEFNRMESILKTGKTPVLIPTYQNRILSEPTKSCPDTHWCVFDAAHSIMLLIEKNIGSVNQYDLADGSIGLRWSKFREGQTWAVETSTYVHEYDDNRGPRECKCYQYAEMEHFNRWLKNTYKTIHLYDYLCSKYSKEKNVVMLDKVREMIPKLLKAS